MFNKDEKPTPNTERTLDWDDGETLGQHPNTKKVDDQVPFYVKEGLHGIRGQKVCRNFESPLEDKAGR